MAESGGRAEHRNALYFRLGVLLLSLMRSPAEVGVFAAAYKLLELGFKILTLAIRVIAPKFFADSKNDPDKFRSEVDLLMRVTSVSVRTVGITRQLQEASR